MIELLIVLAIVGIVAALAAIDYRWYNRDARLSEYQDRMIALVEEAKLRSISGVPHAVVLTGTASFRLVRLNDTNENFVKDAGETTTDVAGNAFILPSGMKITPSGEILWFDRKGIPRTDSTWGFNNTTLNIWYDDNGDGNPDDDEQKKTIVVSKSGRIKYEK
jgi:Tfp pilus assembly protein FimT